MTITIESVMPYGVTFKPDGYQDVILTPVAPPEHMYGASGLRVPSRVFTLLIVSQLAAAVDLRLFYSDDSPQVRRQVIPAGGGRYSAVFSGENIFYIQLLASNQAADRAAGRRATVQIIPVPDPP